MHKTYMELIQDRSDMIEEAKALLATIKAATPTAAYAGEDTNSNLKDALRYLRISASHSQKQYRP